MHKKGGDRVTNSLTMKTNSEIVEIGGQAYRMDFDPQALSHAEQVYLRHFDRAVNAGEIITELYGAQLSAVMAFAYGAMRSAGNDITWQRFAKDIFTLDDCEAVFEATTRAIRAMSPEPTAEDIDAAGAGDDPKN